MKSPGPLLAILVFLLAGCGSSQGVSPAEPSNEPPGPANQASPPENPDPSLCTRLADAGALNGHRVRLHGIYRKQMSLKKMPRPGRPPEMLFLGYAGIEVADGGIVGLGEAPRDAEEIERFLDKAVEVVGILDLNPVQAGDFARPAPKPVLREPTNLRPLESSP